jgi:hypothetical protein
MAVPSLGHPFRPSRPDMVAFWSQSGHTVGRHGAIHRLLLECGSAVRRGPPGCRGRPGPQPHPPRRRVHGAVRPAVPEPGGHLYAAHGQPAPMLPPTGPTRPGTAPSTPSRWLTGSPRSPCELLTAQYQPGLLVPPILEEILQMQGSPARHRRMMCKTRVARAERDNDWTSLPEYLVVATAGRPTTPKELQSSCP